jgi:hypothetical protein
VGAGVGVLVGAGVGVGVRLFVQLPLTIGIKLELEHCPIEEMTTLLALFGTSTIMPLSKCCLLIIDGETGPVLADRKKLGPKFKPNSKACSKTCINMYTLFKILFIQNLLT